MTIVKSTVKGQILIPAPLRKKYSIGKGTMLRIVDSGKHIIVEPLQPDVIEEGRGLLKSQGRVLKSLIRDRKAEAKQ